MLVQRLLSILCLLIGTSSLSAQIIEGNLPKGEQFRLLDPKGQRTLYYGCNDMGPSKTVADRIIVEKNGKHGVVNGKGHYILPANYTQHTYFDLPLDYDATDSAVAHRIYTLCKGSRVGAIRDYKIIVPFSYMNVLVIQPSAYPVPANDTSESAALNKGVFVYVQDGKEVWQYDLATKRKVGKSLGNELIAYDHKDYAYVFKKDSLLIYKEGQRVKPSTILSDDRHLFVATLHARNEQLYGLINRSGTVLLKMNYKKIGTWDSEYQLACVAEKEAWGAVNFKGKVIIPFAYKRVFLLEHCYKEEGHSAFFVVTENKSSLSAIFDKAGKPITPFKYTEIACMENDGEPGFVAYDEEGDRYFINYKGKATHWD